MNKENIIDNDGFIKDGVYEIQICNSNLVLDVESVSFDDGARLIAFERTGGLNQCFRINHIEDGIYTIIAVHSSKAIGIDKHSKEVQTKSYNLRDDTTKWKFEKLDFVIDNFFQFKIENVHCGLVLDLEDERWENETPICVFDYHGGFNQQFGLIPKEIPQEILEDIFSAQEKADPKSKDKKDDFDNIMDLLNPKNNFNNKNDFNYVDTLSQTQAQMQAMLESMKKQIDELKAVQESQKIQKEDKNNLVKAEIQEEINRYQEDIRNLIFKAMDADNRIKVFTTLISAVSCNGKSSTMTTNISDTISLDEDRLAAALEPFTNPRRIKLLKVLMEKELAANEISQATGLVGGQLYHHLQNLENAGLIEKNGDKYKTVDKQILAFLTVAVSNTKIANEK